MALIACPECSQQISNQAGKCPHCGAKVKKPAGVVSKVLAGFLLLIVGKCAFELASPPAATTPPAASPAPLKPTGHSKDIVLQLVKLEKLAWQAGGFETVMLIDATINNESMADVKDPVVRCSLYAPSGTQLGRLTKTVYQTIPAGKKHRLKEFSMGFRDSQAKQASCEVVDLVIL